MRPRWCLRLLLQLPRKYLRAMESSSCQRQYKWVSSAFLVRTQIHSSRDDRRRRIHTGMCAKGVLCEMGRTLHSVHHDIVLTVIDAGDSVAALVCWVATCRGCTNPSSLVLARENQCDSPSLHGDGLVGYRSSTPPQSCVHVGWHLARMYVENDMYCSCDSTVCVLALSTF